MNIFADLVWDDLWSMRKVFLEKRTLPAVQHARPTVRDAFRLVETAFRLVETAFRLV